MGRGVQAFFLPADRGARFVLFQPAQRDVSRGTILYVHPFAEEMNKARRMAALQARAFADAGYDVMRIDLYGCGDSSGNFGDARWDIWKHDLALAGDWLAVRGKVPVHLWGMRLGAMLGLDYWREQPARFASAILWQPVASGETFMTQFLRLAVAGDALRGGASALTTGALRNRLKQNESIEVAGYELAPVLVEEIDSLNLANWAVQDGIVHWLDVRSGEEPPMATQRILDKWRERGIETHYRAVPGDPFWTTQEITEVPALLNATLACLN